MNMKIAPTISLLLVLFSFISAFGLHATELDRASQITDSIARFSTVVNILSTEPSTGRVTTLEASGTWRNGCVPQFESVELVSGGIGNGVVHLVAMAEPAGFVCGQEETEWSFPVDVQFELPGTYTVQLSITSVQLDVTELYVSEEIVVAGHIGFSPQIRGVAQSVWLTATGVHYDGCVPEYVSHEIIDGTITVELMTPDSGEIVCGQEQTPWQIDVELVALADGEYVVEVYRSDQYQGAATNRTIYKTATLAFGVAGAQAVGQFIYLPNIVLGN